MGSILESEKLIFIGRKCNTVARRLSLSENENVKPWTISKFQKMSKMLISNLKVITAFKLVLLASNHPFGKIPLFGQPQLISLHSG